MPPRRHRRGTDPEEHAIEPHAIPPGRLADRKSECADAEGFRTPVGDEVESAHLLANEARERLHRLGLDDCEILRYADDFVAADRGQDLDDFISWAAYVHQRRGHREAMLR